MATGCSADSASASPLPAPAGWRMNSEASAGVNTRATNRLLVRVMIRVSGR